MTADPARHRWQILTGEYPPTPGGVADYTGLVARGLAARGDEVHVWAPPIGAGQGGGDEVVTEDGPGGPTVHRLPGVWMPDDFRRVGQSLDRSPKPRRILVQFAPNAFGYRGMNHHLAPWLAGRRRGGDAVRVMFHEVMYIIKPGDRMARRVLAMVQRFLASRLLRAASEVDVNTHMWDALLRPIDPVRRDYGWRPVPSNIPVVDDPGGVAEVRRRLASDGGPLIGSFGTFAGDVSGLLESAILPTLLAGADRSAVLIGRGGERVAESWTGRHPGLAGRVRATGGLGHEDVSRHLQACDILIQPYPGGVATKRGSVMACLANGVATVTTSADPSETIWAESGAVAMAPEGDGPALAALVETLLADSTVRDRLGEAGQILYDDRFSLKHTLDSLAGPASEPASIPAETARP